MGSRPYYPGWRSGQVLGAGHNTQAGVVVGCCGEQVILPRLACGEVLWGRGHITQAGVVVRFGGEQVILPRLVWW